MQNNHSSKSNNQKSKINLDSFYTVSVIGKGSYAKVLLVKKKDTGQYFAMKVLKKQLIEKKKQEDHIKTERDVLITANSHPFIVKLHYAFQNDKNLYFVLDYCYGGELFNLLQQRKRLNESEARFYAAQLVLAIEHLHKNDILYRDLKPENVLICDDGYLKITDFGLSHIAKHLKEPKTFCGTPEYLAPEIVENKGHGKAVDWWTLGSIIFEMMVGVPPFYCHQRSELFERIKQHEPVYPTYFSETTKSLLKGLLQKDPNNRLGSFNGAEDIKNHSWFYPIEWDDILSKKEKPFFRPDDDSKNGLSHFDTEFTNLPLQSPCFGYEVGTCKQFQNFTWNEEVMSSSYGVNKFNGKCSKAQEDSEDESN